MLAPASVVKRVTRQYRKRTLILETEFETEESVGTLKNLSGMARYLHANAVPPAKARRDGSIEDAKGPVGFSAALLPYLSAVGEKDLGGQQTSRMRSEFNSKTGLYGDPAKYYDQNLALFALGWADRRFWFDPQGELKTSWKHD